MLLINYHAIHDCPRNLANMFADYFDGEVKCILSSFSFTTADPMYTEQLYHGPVLCELLLLLGSYPWCSDEGLLFCFFLLFFVNMINLSFKDNLTPAIFKEAVINPIIKKASLDHEIYQNYRLISKLRCV